MESLSRLTTRELRRIFDKRSLSVAYKKKVQLVKRLYSHLMQSGEGISKEISCRKFQGERGCYEEGSAEEKKGETRRGEDQEGCEQSEEERSVKDLGKEGQSAEGQAGRDAEKKQEISGEEPSSVAQTEEKRKMSEGNNFLFRDVEDSLETYSGESTKSFLIWLKDFEEIATVCKWNEIQKFLYARRLLRGAAKLAVEAEEGITSWEKLKTKLKNEFGSEVSSIMVHQMLSSRKKRQNETFLEYLFTMKQIANKGKIDEESLIAYVVQGIPDDPRNKAVLYEAISFSHLKEKYKIYENIKDQIRHGRHVINYESKAGNSSRNNGKKSERRCGNCGAFSHTSANCPDKHKGARCFKCNQFGHIAPNCPLKKEQEGRGTLQSDGRVNTISIPDMHIQVNINGQDFTGLLDTGSDVTLIRKTVVKFANLHKRCEGPSIFLTGFGRNLKRTSGSFLCNVKIQGEDFETRLHIVPDAWISQDVLIGKDVIKDAKVIFEEGTVTIKRLKCPPGEDEECFLRKINLVELVEEDTLPVIEEITCKETREKVKNMVENYSPQKPAQSCIQMKITLLDEAPV